MAPPPAVLSANSTITARCIDPARHVREFGLAAEFHRRMGIPDIGSDWFHHVGRAGWQERNPRVYRLYFREERVVGCLAIAPLRPACVEDLLSGRRRLWWEV